MDRLTSPLRRPRVARATCLAIAVLLMLAALVLGLTVGGGEPAVTHVFVRALAFSSLLSVLPVLILWFLDRRERESAWLFAAAFLWGGLIATTLALPANSPHGATSTADGSPNLTWVQRLKRVFAIDIETCRHCGGRLRVIASIEQPALIERILGHLGRAAGAVDPGHPSRAPPGRPRLI
jgi:hypothetical protein